MKTWCNFATNGYLMENRPFLMTLHRFMACNSNIIGLETINDVIYNNLHLMFSSPSQRSTESGISFSECEAFLAKKGVRKMSECIQAWNAWLYLEHTLRNQESDAEISVVRASTSLSMYIDIFRVNSGKKPIAEVISHLCILWMYIGYIGVECVRRFVYPSSAKLSRNTIPKFSTSCLLPSLG